MCSQLCAIGHVMIHVPICSCAQNVITLLDAGDVAALTIREEYTANPPGERRLLHTGNSSFEMRRRQI